MAVNARGQTNLDGTPVTRASIEGLLLGVNDIRGVATTTARAQLVADLTAVSRTPTAANPLYVHRADASPNGKLEWTVDGTNWYKANSTTGVQVSLGAGGQVVGTGSLSALSFASSKTSTGWTVGGSTITVPEACLLSYSLTVSASAVVSARHFLQIDIGATSFQNEVYGGRYGSLSGQYAVAAGTVIYARVFQDSGSVKTYTGALTVTAEPLPQGW